MIRENIADDLAYIMSVCNELELRQIQMFYSPYFKFKRHVNAVIQTLVTENLLEVVPKESEEEETRIRLKGTPRVNPDYQERITKSFWIPARHTRKVVKDIQTGCFPTLMMVVFETGNIIDISMIKTPSEAQLGMVNRQNLLPNDTDDAITHVVMVEDKSLIPQIESYQYDQWTQMKDIINGKKQFYNEF